MRVGQVGRYAGAEALGHFAGQGGVAALKRQPRQREGSHGFAWCIDKIGLEQGAPSSKFA